MRAVACFMTTASLMAGSATLAQTATIQVDLRDAQRGLFHSDMTFPARPGPITLVYPRWIPGDHLPAGPIENLAGLVFKANGKVLPWKRDVFDVDAFHIVVPEGTDRVEAHLDFLASPPLVTAINQASKATTDNLAILRWHVATLYPADAIAAAYAIKPSLLVPQGWRATTAMTAETRADGALSFPETTLARLIDSPVATGRLQRTYDLTPKGSSVRHSITVTADDPADLVVTEQQRRNLTAMIEQARLLFGPEPFPHYDFLVTVSGKLRTSVSVGGQEHQESSDNVGGPGLFRDPAGRASIGEVLAHEYAHSWNGKYRRPIGETTPNFQQPNDNSLLWVYEGLTTYLGEVLAVRSGAWSEQDLRDDIADLAGEMMAQEGRRWRPLSDTAVGLQALMRARISSWGNWRRSIDYYQEGALLWMDVDVEIRRLSGGKRSLDDFCRKFLAKSAEDPLVKPYNLDEIVESLQAVAPADWRGFLSARLDSVGSTLPRDVLTRAGWALDYAPQPSALHRADEGGGHVDAVWSIGMSVAGDGEVQDVRWGSLAASAGLAPGMKLLSVSGTQYRADRLRAAIDTGGTIPFTFANGDAVRSVSLRYGGGQKYPVLQRGSGKDYIAAIARPLSASTGQ